jgi:hypothetical protein
VGDEVFEGRGNAVSDWSVQERADGKRVDEELDLRRSEAVKHGRVEEVVKVGAGAVERDVAA